MQFQFDNLDHTTRILMLDELRRDVAARTLFASRRLSLEGRAIYPSLLAAVLARGDVEELTHQLRQQGRLERTELRRTKAGEIEVRVPHTAARTLAEGAFNHYYIRAVARRAIRRGDRFVEVYRAKRVLRPRPESLAKEGERIDPLIVLSDLRGDGFHGVPAGPNSGLSVRLLPAERVPAQRVFVARPRPRRVPMASGLLAAA